MRYLIHDFAGHPFQVQLSRELAARGNDVQHVFPLGLQGPKGRIDASAADGPRFQLRGVPLGKRFKKYSPVSRFLGQRAYASGVKRLIAAEKPDLVLSGNTPIDIQAELLLFCQHHGIAFVHWVQDVYSHAIEFVLKRKLGALAGPVSFPFAQIERMVARRSDGVVAISPAFQTLMAGWGVREEKINVLENWAPLDEVPSRPRRNAWAERHALLDRTVFLYSGTLGLKHRPDLLYRLASELDDSCKVVVITEGVGRQYLEKQPPLSNLLLLDFQPYDQIPEVLASADVLLATLESDAGQFAVPSKILTYLCASRPILLSAPLNNLACAVLERSGGGIAVGAEDEPAFLSAARRLGSDAAHRMTLGQSGRAYAEAQFDIRAVTTNFENVFGQCLLRRKGPALAPTFQPKLKSSNKERWDNGS